MKLSVLLNLFREPPGNYLAVQHFLDSQDNTHCVLLSDLAKAFERVNPHWIIHVLAARGVAFWVINYCRHILFGRKVLHKIGSTFRPSLPINIGVDMGRAFSVLLFCIAMDPWYHHVNRIPDVIVNKGYMDDNATGGIGLSWVYSAEKLLHGHCRVFSPFSHLLPSGICCHSGASFSYLRLHGLCDAGASFPLGCSLSLPSCPCCAPALRQSCCYAALSLTPYWRHRGMS